MKKRGRGEVRNDKKGTVAIFQFLRVTSNRGNLAHMNRADAGKSDHSRRAETSEGVA